MQKTGQANSNTEKSTETGVKRSKEKLILEKELIEDEMVRKKKVGLARANRATRIRVARAGGKPSARKRRASKFRSKLRSSIKKTGW